MYKKLESFMEQAKKNKNFTCRADVSIDEIKVLEKKFKISLPNDYAYFLEKYGYCFWFGEVVCGLVGENKRYENLCCIMGHTMHYHELYDNDTSYLSVPNAGIVIGSYDGGGYYFLFSKDSEREGEVGLFLTETFGQEVSSFASFTDYLSYIVTGIPEPVLVQVDYDKINNIINK